MPRVFLFCAILSIGASSLFAAGGDAPLWAGLGAYRSGDCDSALALLGHSTDNPYLETFRLYYRADCLLRDSLYQDAAATLETLFALVDSGAVVQNHRFVERAGDLYGEALAGRGNCVPGSSTPPPSRIRILSSRVWFLASRACLAAGDTARAMEDFVNGATDGHLTPADSSIFKELFRRCETSFSARSDWDFLAISQGARNIGLFTEANTAISHALERKPDDPDALLSRAMLMVQSGRLGQALRAYWRIFDSAAPVRAKASALLQVASIEYDLKRYDKAAKHYFMCATFYPGMSDDFALNMAARIHVMRREWKKALSAWTILRMRYRGERPIFQQHWIEGGLSEAVLRSWLGENPKAHAILRDILPRARGAQCASVLFWLAKTSPDDAERRVYSDSLLREQPRSFYASLIRGETSALLPGPQDSDAREMEALARCAADRRARCDTARADSVFARHPALRAYVDLLDHRCNEEAEATARAMFGIQDLLRRPRDRAEWEADKEQAMLEVMPERLFKLYAEASRHGLDALSLTLLSFTSPTDSMGELPADLWYPVSYIDEIRAGAASAGLSPFLILAIIREESRFDPNAGSRAGAIGLMQLMPATASWHSGLTDTLRLDADDLRDPAKNIRAGVAYFRYLLERFNGSMIGALAAYNGGEGRMARWKENFVPADNPLVALELIGPRETRLYVKKVLDAQAAYAAMAREAACAE